MVFLKSYFLVYISNTYSLKYLYEKKQWWSFYFFQNVKQFVVIESIATA